MAEVSPLRALDPAARTTTRGMPDNVNRITPSSVFRGLLRGPLLALHLAHGPATCPGRPIGAQTDGESPRAKHGSHPRRDEDAGLEARSEGGKEGLLDPLWCQMAVHPGITSEVVPAPSSAASALLPLREDLQNLLMGLARRVAWGGDRSKGSARIELSGALAGATLVVHTEQRSVSVELELPRGTSVGQGLQQRILDRLEGRGFAARVRVE
jgi:hypothetical protein